MISQSVHSSPASGSALTAWSLLRILSLPLSFCPSPACALTVFLKINNKNILKIKLQLFCCVPEHTDLFTIPQYYPSQLQFTVMEVWIPFYYVSVSLAVFSVAYSLLCRSCSDSLHFSRNCSIYTGADLVCLWKKWVQGLCWHLGPEPCWVFLLFVFCRCCSGFVLFFRFHI